MQSVASSSDTPDLLRQEAGEVVEKIEKARRECLPAKIRVEQIDRAIEDKTYNIEEIDQ